MQSHTAAPIAWPLGGDRYRIFFGTRDTEQAPRIGALDIDLTEPTQPLCLNEDPVLTPGLAGHFDDNGVYPGSLLAIGSETRMYYLGRSNGTPPLFYMAIGLAISHDNCSTFTRSGPAPVLSRSEYDPWMVSTPCVRKENGHFRMWYLSGLGWNIDLTTSRYHIKYAESDDGICWQREGRVCIDFQQGESNIASPSVLKFNDHYAMWYSFVDATGQYRIGFAESADGLEWTRRDEALKFEPSAAAWEAQAMAYPHVFQHQQRLYMLYSGNDFGRDGIGIASCDIDK